MNGVLDYVSPLLLLSSYFEIILDGVAWHGISTVSAVYRSHVGLPSRTRMSFLNRRNHSDGRKA